MIELMAHRIVLAFFMFHTLLSCFSLLYCSAYHVRRFLSTKTCPRGNCFRKISKSASFPWYLKSNAKINKIPQFFGGGIYKFLPWCYSSGIERQSKNCFRQYTQLNACRKKEIIMKTRIEADSIGSLEVPSDATTGYSPCGQNGISPSRERRSTRS